MTFYYLTHFLQNWQSMSITNISRSTRIQRNTVYPKHHHRCFSSRSRN